MLKQFALAAAAIGTLAATSVASAPDAEAKGMRGHRGHGFHFHHGHHHRWHRHIYFGGYNYGGCWVGVGNHRYHRWILVNRCY